MYEKANDSEPCIGDKVYYIDGTKVNDGKYKYSFLKFYIIQNGEIIA